VSLNGLYLFGKNGGEGKVLIENLNTILISKSKSVLEYKSINKYNNFKYKGGFDPYI